MEVVGTVTAAAIAKVLLRSTGLADAADMIDDATGVISMLRSWGDRRDGSDPVTREVLKGLTPWIEAELRGRSGIVEPAEQEVADVLQRAGASLVVEAAIDHERATRQLLVDHEKTSRAGLVDEDAHALFRRLLAESVKYIGQHAGQNDGFTYQALLRLLKDQEWVKGDRAQLDLLGELVARATPEDFIAYLEARISDWDFSPWLRERSRSSIERPREVTLSPAGPGSPRETLRADEVADHPSMLVVLGGPGSGKTWFAYRHARLVAHRALEDLRAGKPLESVEIPLFTTWDDWIKQTSSLPCRDALIHAALANGVVENTDRLTRTLRESGCRVVAVVDSLDEAAASTSQTARLRDLLTIGWRVVITSRPAAWHFTSSGAVEPSPRTVELNELTDNDTHAFIHEWFADDSATARSLIGQIGSRPELQQNSHIPLLLTFYCILAKPGTNSSQPSPLPSTRRALYDQITDQLLFAAWTHQPPGTNTLPDLDACKSVLRRWAWSTVENAVHSRSGLGAWKDTFCPTPAPQHLRAALSNVAPLHSQDRFNPGDTTHRFLHRTLLEHFVAEHLATLPVDQVTPHLLQHLWFDPDWSVVAPTTLAYHPHREEILDQLLESLPYPHNCDEAHAAVIDLLEQTILDAAAQTTPHDWPRHKDHIHALRAIHAAEHPILVTQSAHWSESNHAARSAILDALTTDEIDMFDQGLDCIRALPPLCATAEDRACTRNALLISLKTADQWTTSCLIEVLPALCETETDRADARAAVMIALPTIDEALADTLTRSLTALCVTDRERDDARTALLGSLAECVNLKTVPEFAPAALARSLTALCVTDRERDDARTAILRALPDAIHKRYVAVDLIRSLVTLAPTATDLAKARTAIIGALPLVKPSAAVDLARALGSLCITEYERSETRIATLEAHPGNLELATHPAVTALSDSAPTDNELDGKLAAVLNRLANTRGMHSFGLIESLPSLCRTDTDWRDACAAALRALPTADECFPGELAQALAHLKPTAAERAQARKELLALHMTGDRINRPNFSQSMPHLCVDSEDEADARRMILNALNSSDPSAADDLTLALCLLTPTDEERQQARAVLLRLIATDTPAMDRLASHLAALRTPGTDQAEDRRAVLAGLSIARGFPAALLAEDILTLEPTSPERDMARQSILRVLPYTHDPIATSLSQSLIHLCPTDDDRNLARLAVLSTLDIPPDPAQWDVFPRVRILHLLRLLRELSTCTTWTQWLTQPSPPAGLSD